jgi:hypothetical protein
VEEHALTTTAMWLRGMDAAVLQVALLPQVTAETANGGGRLSLKATQEIGADNDKLNEDSNRVERSSPSNSKLQSCGS